MCKITISIDYDAQFRMIVNALLLFNMKDISLAEFIVSICTLSFLHFWA